MKRSLAPNSIGVAWRGLLISIIVLRIATTCTALAQNITQTIPLRNGWNSIWVEVAPTNDNPAVVFAGLPVSSVWTYMEQQSTVEFIQNQSEALFNRPEWLPYFPTNRPDAFLTRLFSIQPLRAYLVNLTNGPAMLAVTGRPIVRAAKWVPDSFNLRGFPVNPAAPPTFGAFFNPSSAHAGQRIYQLQSSGQWTLVNTNALMAEGEAYWVFTRGGSTYSGPLGLRLDFGDGLDFGSVISELAPQFANLSSSPITVNIRPFAGQSTLPLSYYGITTNRADWIPLSNPYAFNLAGLDTEDLRLGIRRGELVSSDVASILEIFDNVGTRYLVPVHAATLGSARLALDQPASTNGLAGLWIGTISVTNVSEPNSSQPLRLTPTRSHFDLRLLLHVAADGQTRLLQQVIQMWQNGTTTNDALGRAVTEHPGRFVLLTDDSLVANYAGASLRDGVPVGRRFSTVDFAISTPNGGTTNVLAMNGRFGIGGTNSCSIDLQPDHPLNPFKHRYHPDHDNLDATYQHYQEEAYHVQRDIALEFTPTDPDATTSSRGTLEYGTSTLGGIYRETITGLHRTNILVSGTFRITRAVNAPALNQ